MSNVAIAYPNRLLELNKLHNCDWVDNSILPLSNIQTPILSETARTSNFGSVGAKHCSFGISLKNLPYRTFGAIGLINHNLTTSAKCRFTVFNEPPLSYSKNALVVNATGSFSITLDTSVASLATGTKLKFYACSSDVTNVTTSYFYATVVSHSGVNLTCTRDNVYVGNGTTFNLWYIGYGAQSGKTESVIINEPSWLSVWKRIYPSSSQYLTWRSKNLWRGSIEEEQRLAFTKIHISFLKDSAGGQPVGTHLHVDLDDSTETLNVDMYLEVGRVFIGQYSQPEINPEYGSIDHNFMDNSELSSSNSGTEYAYEKAKARTVSVQWNHLTEDEAFGGIYEASRSQGITREVLYAYDVDDTGSYQYARSFIGRFTQLNAITQPNVGLFGASINLKEIL
jgi:hypothetical protein